MPGKVLVQGQYDDIKKSPFGFLFCEVKWRDSDVLFASWE